MNPTRRRLLTPCALLCLAACAAALRPAIAIAGDAPPPKARTVLTVAGPGARHTDFDMAALAGLPQHSFKTTTPWHQGEVSFTGPRLRDVLAAAGARGSRLTAVALNDYKVQLPASDAERYDVIVARLQDGQPMPVRERGPLFIVYPYSQSSELRSEKFFTRSAWQLRRIEVE